MTFHFDAIGEFRSAARHPYEAARQAVLSRGEGGVVELFEGRDLELGLRDLEGFSRIWLLYVFHHNPSWKPVVRPPRGSRKVGVFASRAPYRPNPIGLSCVELLSVRGRRIEVGPSDLLDGTPILDIKPYLPYADSFPDATLGWIEEDDADTWQVDIPDEIAVQLAWLESRGAGALTAFLEQQLSEAPLDHRRKRVRPLEHGTWEIAYRTWRAAFSVDEPARMLRIVALRSGYTAEELSAVEDPHADKALHRDFIQWRESSGA
ncbi:MAG: tRNA ((37)-N6)-methyltransferase TrmO [Candidatus Hydrogenedentota bacterium]|jgi:tRNA-Thr(GGU) m(6)t(6)A37 methyltransferase TsaA